MGTRSITRVVDEKTQLVNMYRQMDGYPSGHGKELAAFLTGKKVINGFSSGDNAQNAFNGAGCLAAALVANFKTDLGGIYLFSPLQKDYGEDYEYVVTVNAAQTIKVVVNSCGESVFSGTVAEFATWCAKTDE